jgi:integrase
LFFDARAAKLLQPGAHLVVDGCPGLRLVATASRRTWTYRYKDAAGRMKQRALGQWPAMPVQVAVTEWQALRNAKAAGADPVQQKKADRAAQIAASAPQATVRHLVGQYVAEHLYAARKPKGAAAAERALNALMAAQPAFAAMAPADVTRQIAFDVLASRKDTPTQAAKLRSLLGAAWDYALDAGRLGGNVPNWWRVVMKGRLKSKGRLVAGQHVGQQRRVLPAPEVAELLRWLPNMHPLGQDATVMYLWTCTRGGEFLAMRPEHLAKEATGWWWTVPKAQTKNADNPLAVDLRVPLFGRALKMVQRRLKAVGPSGWLFEDARGEQYTQHDFSTYIYHLQPYSAKAAARVREGGLVLPVTNWTPHNLRRTARTLLASLGCSNEVGEAIVGHMPKDMVATYNAYTYDKERRVWLKRLADYLEGLGRAKGSHRTHPKSSAVARAAKNSEPSINVKPLDSGGDSANACDGILHTRVSKPRFIGS